VTKTTPARVEKIYQPHEPIGRRLQNLLSLEIQKAVLEVAIADEQGYLLKHCQRYGLDILRLAGDRLTTSLCAGRSSWKFTRATEALMKRAKAAQDLEKANGKAKKIPGSPYLSARVGKGAAVQPEPALDIAAFGQAVAEAHSDKAAGIAGGEADAHRDEARTPAPTSIRGSECCIPTAREEEKPARG
jgi:hypothetical protein